MSSMFVDDWWQYTQDYMADADAGTGGAHDADGGDSGTSTGTSTGGAKNAPGGGGTVPSGTVDPATQTDAYQMLLGMLRTWGLESLASVVLDLIKQGYNSDTAISYQLQQTDAYKLRFSGNDLRIKAGLAPLSPDQYLATEAAYQQILQQAGLPAGFYDDPTDYASFIGRNISASELKDRADNAYRFVNTTDESVRTALRDFYGVDDGHLAAYFLDQSRALPLLQKQANAALIGGAALTQGLSVDRDRAELFSDLGVDERTARQGYSTIAELLPDEAAIAHRFGEDYVQGDAEDEMFRGLASAARKRRQLNAQEQSLFSGSGGTGAGTSGSGLSQSTSGQF